MRQTPDKLKRRLFAPAVYALAFLLLFEDWLWDRTLRLLAVMPPLPWQAPLERRIAAMRPGFAVTLFALPGLLLFPVKILAVVMMARGHPLSGLAVIIAAKVGGTFLVAWIYRLVRPQLFALPWFARLHGWSIAFKDRMIARLRAAPAWRRARRTAMAARRQIRRAAARLWRHAPAGPRRERVVTLLRRLRRRATRARNDDCR